jgi:hypothetical protein
MEQSTEISELTAALAAAQSKFRKAKRTGKNPDAESTYAPFDEVVAASRSALTRNGIAVSQWPTAQELAADADGLRGWLVAVETQIAHKSGQWMRTTMRMPLLRIDGWGVKSATTYAKRIAYEAAVGVTVEGEDDDGRAAIGLPSEKDDIMPPGAGETTRLHSVVHLSTTRRKGRKYFRIKMSDGRIYGSHDNAITESVFAANGADVDVSWKPSKAEGEREILAVTAVPPDQQSEEPIV